MLRLRKNADGTFSFNQVTPSPSGLSHARDLETTILTMSADDAAQIAKDYTEGPAAVPAQTSDNSQAKGLSNATPESPKE